MSKKLIC